MVMDNIKAITCSAASTFLAFALMFLIFSPGSLSSMDGESIWNPRKSMLFQGSSSDLGELITNAKFSRR